MIFVFACLLVTTTSAGFSSQTTPRKIFHANIDQWPESEIARKLTSRFCIDCFVSFLFCFCLIIIIIIIIFLIPRDTVLVDLCIASRLTKYPNELLILKGSVHGSIIAVPVHHHHHHHHNHHLQCKYHGKLFLEENGYPSSRCN